MNWPIYLVWDEFQADLVQRALNTKAIICVVGPIWFSHSPKCFDIPKGSIAVFDVEPISRSSHFAFSTMADYNYPDAKVHKKFMLDIFEVVGQKGISLTNKRKRMSAHKGSKSYDKLIQEFEKSSSFYSIDPMVSPFEVIEKCSCVISIPFTSTGIIAKHLSKPSAFYDPTGLLQKWDRGSHGLPILSNKKELELWIDTVYKLDN